MNENHGFKLVESKFFEDINGTIYLYEHIKTGALLTIVKNEDVNKVFIIGFRTPSNNSTGVAHIMEHSTLCGSEKYPVKEPFVELAKGSLNTFLNAMTYSDKTLYPIASTNDKDFRNLMDVYLDAVFNPKIYENPYTFMQEGWHYHLEEKDQPLIYNGVVYNEMKGVFSDPDSLLELETYNALFPDTIYSKESGGHPSHIPELTYEDFLNFHKTYYHPSNSFIYLYGNIDIDDQLAYLNEWLDKYEKKDIEINIPKQESLKERAEVVSTYPVVANETLENKDKIALSFVLDDLTPDKKRKMNILMDVLAGNTSSILKKTLLEELDVGNVSVQFDTSIKQPVLSIILKDANKDQKDKFIETVNRVLTEQYENGIREEDLLASLNTYEFRLLETLGGETGSYPKGLLFGLSLYEDWLYGGSPLVRLDINDQIKELKEFKENKGYESLIKEYLLDNPFQALVILTPDTELNRKNEEALRTELDNYKNSLTDEELEILVETTKKLIEAQNREDTKEELATIPRLSVSEIDKEVNRVEWKELEVDNTPVLFIESDSDGIIYLDLNFDLRSIEGKDIKYFSLLESLLGSLNTKNYTNEEIIRNVDINTGGIAIYDHVLQNINSKETTARMTVRTSIRVDNIKKSLELLEEVIKNTLFDNKELIKTLISARRLGKKSVIQNSGNSVASLRSAARTSKEARIIEDIEGMCETYALN